MFELPPEWESFYEDMTWNARKYIKINFWQIKEEDFLLWLKNFETDHEKFIAALIIYRIIYRNNDSMLSMYYYIIDIILPNVLADLGFELPHLDELHKRLNRGEALPFKFSTIENVDDQTGKSGNTILRDFARYGGFHKRFKISSERLSDIDRETCKVVVLFDDIMGTGEQFTSYLEKYHHNTKGLTLIYTPLSATRSAIDSFNHEKFTNVKIAPVEILDERYNFFDKKFMPKIAESIDNKKLREIYIDLIKHKTKLKHNLLGRGDQALTYIFSVSTPNNTLPILWYSDDQWHGLVPR